MSLVSPPHGNPALRWLAPLWLISLPLILLISLLLIVTRMVWAFGLTLLRGLFSVLALTFITYAVGWVVVGIAVILAQIWHNTIDYRWTDVSGQGHVVILNRWWAHLQFLQVTKLFNATWWQAQQPAWTAWNQGLPHSSPENHLLFLIICIVPLAPTFLVGGYLGLTLLFRSVRDAVRHWRSWLPLERFGTPAP